MPKQTISQPVFDLLLNSPYRNDKYFIMGYLKGHLDRFAAQLAVLPKNIDTASDRIADRFSRTYAADCLALMQHLHDLTNPGETVTDEEAIAANWAGVDFQPVLKVQE